MTITAPWRRITLHFSQIFFTLGRTFNLDSGWFLGGLGAEPPAGVVGGSAPNVDVYL